MIIRCFSIFALLGKVHSMIRHINENQKEKALDYLYISNSGLQSAEVSAGRGKIFLVSNQPQQFQCQVRPTYTNGNGPESQFP